MGLIIRAAIILLFLSCPVFGFEVGDVVETTEVWGEPYIKGTVESVIGSSAQLMVDEGVYAGELITFADDCLQLVDYTVVVHLGATTQRVDIYYSYPGGVYREPIAIEKKEENIMGFMFGVLGSVTFWIVYGAISIFIGSLMLKNLAPNFYRYLMTGKDNTAWDPVGPVFFGVMVGCFIIWPITLIIYTGIFIISRILWPLFVKAIRASVSMVPDIEIKRKDS